MKSLRNLENTNHNFGSGIVLLIKYIIVLSVFSFFAFSCSEDEGCGYNEPCEENCELFEDFEDETIGSPGNWQGIALNGLGFQLNGGSKTLYADDGGGGSWAYNDNDFPENLIAAGCSIHYDVAYFGGVNNPATADNGLVIYSGPTPIAASTLAIFVFNSTNVIISGNPLTTVEIPLELATGTNLPSNSFGEWRLGGGVTPPYTPTEVSSFNALIQNIDGVAFAIDEGGNPIEEWWFDNFCFNNCCNE